MPREKSFICKDCGTLKTKANTRTRVGKTGLLYESYCKKCERTRRKLYQQQNPGKYREYNKRFRKTNPQAHAAVMARHWIKKAVALGVDRASL